MNEEESMSKDEKKFLYARTVHSNQSIQYHMHQTIEQQRVFDKYKNMTMEGMDLIALVSNLLKYDLVIISQIINMIETDGFWHHKTFESVLSNLRNLWTEGIHELENASIYCTNNAKNDAEMDGVQVMDLCSLSQNKNEAHGGRKESTKQKSQDKTKPTAMDRMEDEFRTKKSKSTTKNEEAKVAMMCWEATNNFMKEEPREGRKETCQKDGKTKT